MLGEREAGKTRCGEKRIWVWARAERAEGRAWGKGQRLQRRWWRWLWELVVLWVECGIVMEYEQQIGMKGSLCAGDEGGVVLLAQAADPSY